VALEIPLAINVLLSSWREAFVWEVVMYASLVDDLKLSYQ